MRERFEREIERHVEKKRDIMVGRLSSWLVGRSVGRYSSNTCVHWTLSSDPGLNGSVRVVQFP